ncbi:MAG: efflux RND transporter permease subunit [Pseudohongiellaceae bacterium]
MTRSHSLIEQFVRHPVACNLVMIMMILSGLWAATRINTQLDPSVEWPVIQVMADWPGASAQDIEQLVVSPIEQRIRTVQGLQNMSSRTVNGSTRIYMEFSFDTDMARVLGLVEDRVGQIRNLPPELETLQITRGTEYENIATLVVSGASSASELVPLVRRFERELYGSGVDMIRFNGLPQEELAIQVGAATLQELDTTLDQLANDIRQRSVDAPAGLVGRDQGLMQLRGLEQRRGTRGFEELVVNTGSAADLLRLGDVARIDRRPRPDQPVLMKNGQPAVEMRLYRVVDSDAIDSANALNRWLDRTRPTLPAGIGIDVYEEVWVLLKEQLNVIASNAWSGLVLVVLTLLVFLTARVGFWVTAGIPVSFLFAALLYYGLFEGSINILALITFIMALGIVVDDAIVVGEDAVSLHQQGLSPQDAATGAARRMFAPVVTSSLTTLAAFVPLILAGGEMGAVIQTMPMVLFCVILASLVECFLVLPGHLKRSLEKMDPARPGRFRQWFDTRFSQFRERRFRPLLRLALDNPGATVLTAVGCVVLAFSLTASGRVGMNFVTGLSLQVVQANVAFSASASAQQRQTFMREIERSMLETDQALGGNNTSGHVLRFNHAWLDEEDKSGPFYGSLHVEYTWEDTYDVPPAEFVDAWRQRVEQPAWVERLQLEVRGGANNGAPDLSLVLRGEDLETLKQASEELQAALLSHEGVETAFDNLPYGKDQIIFSLTPAGDALGLTTQALGRQLNAAYNGNRVQIFDQNNAEVEVIVTLPDEERNNIAYLNRFPVRTPAGETVPLQQVASLSKRRGIDVINHSDGMLSVQVSATVDSRVNNAQRLLTSVQENELQEIRQRHGLTSGLGGVSERNQQIVDTLTTGAALTLIFIYLILVWSFSSWSWPLAVLATIPLGLTGAIAGHWIMGVDIGVFSLLAFFALVGVVVNDAIVLISFLRRELAAGVSLRQALEQASLARFRAVLLTSLTTVAGLSPLMFETFSLAMYMVPIAITLCFGLAFATLLVLLVIPSLILLIERLRAGWHHLSAFVVQSGSTKIRYRSDTV